jgi:CDP-diacylglycerol--glycerol-3-phosphate 3-phosphatidyltransferase
MSERAEAANIITCARIVMSVALLFVPALSPAFYVLYLVAGFTDIIDGEVARRTGTTSAFGAKLDSVADTLFVVVCLLKLLHILAVPSWLWVWIALVTLIKVANIIYGYATHKRYVALHTPMNKVTGVLLFVLPLTFPFVELKYSAPLVCAVATFAAIQEGRYIKTGREIEGI